MNISDIKQSTIPNGSDATLIQPSDWNQLVTRLGTAIPGGSAITSYAVGDLVYASTTSALVKLPIGAVNAVLTSSGSAPGWSTTLALGGLALGGALTFSPDNASDIGALATSRPRDLFVGRHVQVGGQLKAADGTAAAPGISFGSSTNLGLYALDTGTIGFASGGLRVASLDGSGLYVDKNLLVLRDLLGASAQLSSAAANTLALRNGTATQELQIGPAGSALIVSKAIAAGALIATEGDQPIWLGTNNTVRWIVQATTGHLLANGAYNIGDGAGNSPVNIYAETAVAVGTNPANGGAIRLPNDQGLYARNAANTVNVEIAYLTTGNVARFGASGAASVQVGDAATVVTVPGGALAIGTNPAQSGAVRLANNAQITARNQTNTADVVLLQNYSDDQIYLGTPSVSQVNIQPALAAFGGQLDLTAASSATDPTAGGGAATGRIAIRIAGATRYLAYY